MFAGMALSVHLLVYVGLSLFIINGPYIYMVVCIVYAYNLTNSHFHEPPPCQKTVNLSYHQDAPVMTHPLSGSPLHYQTSLEDLHWEQLQIVNWVPHFLSHHCR